MEKAKREAIDLLLMYEREPVREDETYRQCVRLWNEVQALMIQGRGY
jgi:hypothetical protein